MLDNFEESGNLLFFIASLTQFVRKCKKESHSFNVFRGHSPPATLFEEKSFTMSLTNSSETDLKENLLVIV